MASLVQRQHRCATSIAFAGRKRSCHAQSDCAAEGFRIETKIYVGDEEKPPSETTTLFLDGVVYDFLANRTQTAVFRKPTGGKPGRFILLDPQQRIQTEISTDQLTGAMDEAAHVGRASRTIHSCNSRPIRSSKNRSNRKAASSCWPAIWKPTRSATSPPNIRRRWPSIASSWTGTRSSTRCSPPALPPEPRLRAERSAGPPQGRAAQGRADTRGRKRTAPRRARIHLAALAATMQNGSKSRAPHWPAIAHVSEREFLRTTRPKEE